MPYKQEYNSKTVGKGASKTPAGVMGSQGSPAKIPQSFNKSKSTGYRSFESMFPNVKPAKRHNHA